MDKIIIYNPRNGGEINDIFAKNKYKHEVNTLKKYDKILADYLLKKYAFLIKVEPKDLPGIKEIMEAKFKCKDCDYVTSTEKQLSMHILGKHKITQEVMDAYNSIEDTKPIGEFNQIEVKSIEEQEGIGGEKEGWYGGGLESDNPGPGKFDNK